MSSHVSGNKGLISDNQLFLAISRGSESAFRFIFERYHQRMWAFVMTLVKSPHIAEDIVQESFIKLWECRAILADVKKPNDFIFILVRNHALDSLRKLTREDKERERDQVWEDLKRQSVYVDYWLEAKQAAQILEQIIAQLPCQQQKVIRLRHNRGLSHQEIADYLQISKNTVKKHLAIALKTCREELKRMGFSYFFVLPLLLFDPVFVFNIDDNTRIDEQNEETYRGTVAKVQHQHLQQERV